MVHFPTALAIVVAFVANGSRAESACRPGSRRSEATGRVGAPSVTFVNEAAEAGVLAANASGGAEKRFIVETTGAGSCWFDYDRDGDLDLYLVNGGALEPDGNLSVRAGDTLYRNEGGGRFTDATAAAGLADRAWGGGCSVGDYDNDGDPDLYVTNLGLNILYRNEGDGTFADVTVPARVGDLRWSLGSAFFDFDADGDLDLYVANYLRFDLDVARSSECFWKGIPVMCGPRGFQGEHDALYRNDGSGSFTDVSAEAGITGRSRFGMGVVVGDLDGNGHPDVFVANDSQDNDLHLNDGRGRFVEGALAAGVALSADGRQQASMGADLGDYDGDGDEDLVVTNFSDDYHTLYRNDGAGLFTDVTAAAGLDAATRSSLGWGVGFFDYDNDGDLDLFIAGGHVYSQVDGRDPATSYRQPNLLFRNEDDGRFTDVSSRSGPGLAETRSSRGVAFGDYDDDGDVDLMVVNENDAPSLLRNDGGNAGRWLKVRLVGSRSGRDAIGARVRMHAGGRTQHRELRLSSGYCSSHDPRLHFGLGDRGTVDRLEVLWPSGRRHELVGLPSGVLVTIDEDRGLVSAEPPGTRTGARDRSTRGTTAITPSPPAPAGPDTVPQASGGRLSALALREVDRLVQAGTRGILSGQYAEGIATYERALAVLPAWEEAALSPDALGFGTHDRYRAYLAALYDNLGVGLMRGGRLHECATAITWALELVPGRAKFHRNLGLCHLHGRRYQQAVAALTAAREAGDSGPLLRYDLGRALALAGRCGEAVGELSGALEALPRPDRHGRDAEAWYHLGTCLADQGRPGDAVEAFRETLAAAPGHQKALYRLAMSLRRAGRSEAADRAQALFQARQPAEEAIRSLALAGLRGIDQRLHAARRQLEAGQPGQALVDLELILQARPAHPTVLVLSGQAALALRPPDLAGAEQAFRRSLQADAREVESIAGLAEVLLRQGSLAAAEARFREALAIRPLEAAEVGLARTAFAAGRSAEAVAMLQSLLARRPDAREALRALAEIHALGGPGLPSRPDEALRLLDRAVSRYGEDVTIRLHAHLSRRDRESARRLIEDSPFLGRAQQAALGAILPSAP